MSGILGFLAGFVGLPVTVFIMAMFPITTITIAVWLTASFVAVTIYARRHP